MRESDFGNLFVRFLNRQNHIKNINLQISVDKKSSEIVCLRNIVNTIVKISDHTFLNVPVSLHLSPVTCVSETRIS